MVVELVDGRVMRGDPDARTDDRLLWLRREETGIQLQSGFRWERVLAVHHDRRVYTAEEFMGQAQRIKTARKSFLEVAPYVASREADPGIRESVTEHEPSVKDLLHRSQVERRVKTLFIEAYLAQWDGDPQSDGLRVFVYPLSADGELVPTNGQLDLSLLGEIEKTGIAPEFRELERGSQIVHARDFAQGPGVYQLPFRQFHPDFQFDVARQAAVHARLGIPGMGAVEATDANVQLRGFSRMRDQLQMHRGRRFFPGENAVQAE